MRSQVLAGRIAPTLFAFQWLIVARRQRTAKMGPFQIDVSDVAEALEIAEGPDHR